MGNVGAFVAWAHEVITAGVIGFEICFKMWSQKVVNRWSDCGNQ